MCPDGEVLALEQNQHNLIVKRRGLTRAVQLWDTICPGVAD